MPLIFKDALYEVGHGRLSVGAGDPDYDGLLFGVTEINCRDARQSLAAVLNDDIWDIDPLRGLLDNGGRRAQPAGRAYIFMSVGLEAPYGDKEAAGPGAA